jgi:hypothetical protein
MHYKNNKLLKENLQRWLAALTAALPTFEHQSFVKKWQAVCAAIRQA